MFGFIKEKLGRIYTQFTEKVHSLFSRETLDEATLKELELLLLQADVGSKGTKKIMSDLQQKYNNGFLEKGDDLKEALEQHLLAMLHPAKNEEGPLYLMVGINGSGKTTFASKLAHTQVQEGKKVLMAAADTFRAAATEQLAHWAQTCGVDIVTGKEGQDPASVVFTACQKYKDENYDVLIIDTAGRLQNKTNLMKELEKIRKIISKQLPDTRVTTLLTIDSMLGQNSLEQARLFNESTSVDGIVLTKMDGTGKGGIVFAISDSLAVPVAYISYGEQPTEYSPFSGEEFVAKLLEFNK